MDIITEEFKKKYPHLAKEMKENKMQIRMHSVRTQTSDEEKSPTTLSGYTPDAVAFIRRCNNTDEAKEIIDFLDRQGKISHEYAEKLHIQLRKRGLRSFGSKKEVGYYFKQGKV